MSSQEQIELSSQKKASQPERKKRIKKEKADNVVAVSKKSRKQPYRQEDYVTSAFRQRIGELQIPDSLRLFFMRELKQTVPVIKEILPEHKFLLFGEIPLDMDFFINKMKIKKLSSTRSGLFDRFRSVVKSTRFKNRIEFDLDGSQTALTEFQYIIEALRSINNDMAHDFAQQLQDYQDVVRRILARNAYYRQQLQDNKVDMSVRLSESLKKAAEILETLNPNEEIFIYNIISKQFNGMVTVKKGYSRGLISCLGVNDEEFEKAVKENKLHSSMMEQVNHANVIYSQQKMQQNPYIRLRAHEVVKSIHPDMAHHHSNQFQNILKNLLKKALSQQNIVKDFLSRENQPDNVWINTGNQNNNQQRQEQQFRQFSGLEAGTNGEFIPNPLPSFTQYQKFIKNIHLHPLKHRFPLHKQIELFQNITQVLTKKQSSTVSGLPETDNNLNSLNLPYISLSSQNLNNDQDDSNNLNFSGDAANNPLQMEIEEQTFYEKIQNPIQGQNFSEPSRSLRSYANSLPQQQTNLESDPQLPPSLPGLPRRLSFDITEFLKRQEAGLPYENDENEIEKLSQFLFEESQSNPNDYAVSGLFEEFCNFTQALKSQKSLDLFSSQIADENSQEGQKLQEEQEHQLFYDQQSFQKPNSQSQNNSVSASSSERSEAIQPQNLDDSKNKLSEKSSGVYFHSHEHCHDGDHSPGTCYSLLCLVHDDNSIDTSNHHHHHSIYQTDSSSASSTQMFDPQQNKIKDFYEQLLQYIGNDDEEDGLFPFLHINSTFKRDIINEYEQLRSLLEDNYFMGAEQFDQFIKQIMSEPRIKKKQYLKHLMKIPDREDYSQKEQRKRQQRLKKKIQDSNLSSFLSSDSETVPQNEQRNFDQNYQRYERQDTNNMNSNYQNFNKNTVENQRSNTDFRNPNNNGEWNFQGNSNYSATNKQQQNSYDLQFQNQNNSSSEKESYQHQFQNDTNPNQYSSQSFQGQYQQQSLFQQKQQFQPQFQGQELQNPNSREQFSTAGYASQRSQDFVFNGDLNLKKTQLAGFSIDLSQDNNVINSQNISCDSQNGENIKSSDEINNLSSCNNQKICHRHLHAHPMPNPKSLILHVQEYFKAEVNQDQAQLLENIKTKLKEIIHKGFLNKKMGEFLLQEGNFNKATDIIGTILTNKESLATAMEDNNKKKQTNPEVCQFDQNLRGFKKPKKHSRQDQVIKKVYELNTNISQDDEININEYLEVYYIGKTKIWRDFSKDFILNNSFRDIQEELSKLSQNELLQKYYPSDVATAEADIKNKANIEINNITNNYIFSQDNPVINCEEEKSSQSENKPNIPESDQSDLNKIDLTYLKDIIKQFKMGPPHPFKILLGLKKSLQKIIHNVPTSLISQPFVKNALKMIVFFLQGDTDNYIRCRKRVPSEAIDGIEKKVIKKLCQIPII